MSQIQIIKSKLGNGKCYRKKRRMRKKKKRLGEWTIRQEEQFARLNKVARTGLIMKVKSERTPERSERGSKVTFRGREFLAEKTKQEP